MEGLIQFDSNRIALKYILDLALPKRTTDNGTTI